MAADEIKARIVSILPRDLLIDLLDTAVARAHQAHELIRDNTDLTGRGARGLEGQARFRLMEKGFQDTCERHGGMRLEGDVIPGTGLRYYQPFMRFGGDHPGVLLGLASMPEPMRVAEQKPIPARWRDTELPPDTASGPGWRWPDGKAGRHLHPLLFARDPSQGGRLQEVAIGVIDAEYQGLLVYETVETFMGPMRRLPPKRSRPQRASRSSR